MKRSFRRVTIVVVLSVISFMTGQMPVYAQASRTWVSGVGDDANPCSRTAPCKTFAGAISKTASGGEISVLDPGGFGAVTITKSITIDGGGIQGSILSAGTVAIVVNAAASDTIVIRNLNINGAKTGTDGIRFIAGGFLHVSHVSIIGLTGLGINFTPAGGGKAVFEHVEVRNAATGGISVGATSPASSQATIIDSTMERGGFGVRVTARGFVTVSRTHVSINTSNGFAAEPGAAGPAVLNIEDSVSANNVGTGVQAVVSGGGTGTARISNVAVFGNGAGLGGNGSIVSFGNNTVSGNGDNSAGPTGNGVPTQTLPRI